MAKKIYEESNIREIGNALRRKLGNTKTVDLEVYARTESANSNGHDNCPIYNTRPTWADSMTECIHIPGAKKIFVIMTTAGTAYGYFYGGYVYLGGNSFPGTYDAVKIGTNQKKQTLVFENTEYLTFKLYANDNADYGKEGYYCQIVALDENENAIDFNNGSKTTATLEIKNKFKTADMATAVDSITTGSSIESTFTTKDITENGTYNASTDDGVDGYSSVTVSVVPPRANKTITENGVYYADDESLYGYDKVTVDVGFSPNLQAKDEFYTENGIYTVTADNGYDGLGRVSVTVNVAGEGGSGGGSSYANIEFDAGLDDYPIVYEGSNRLVSFYKSGVSFTTKKVWGSSTSSYAHYVNGETAVVGDNVMDHLAVKTITNTNYANMGYFYQSSSSTTPTWDNIRYSSGTQMVYRYDNVTVSGDINSDLGGLILCNNEGTILFNGKWQDAANALNNRSIDITKGVLVLSNTNFRKTQNYVKQATISFNTAQ